MFLGVVVARRDSPGIDLDIARQVQKLPGVAGDLLAPVNYLGAGWHLTLLTGIFVVLFLIRRRWAESILLVTTLVPRILQEGFKAVFDAPRPSPSVLEVREFPGNASYPSGHVVGTTVVFVLLYLLVPLLSRDARLIWPVRAFGLFMIAAVPFARMWNGAHWPSDCIGGYLFAALWLIPSVALYRLTRDAGGGWRGGLGLTRPRQPRRTA